ncbi:MAG: hypothetical protein WBW13_26740, partial [Pseudolabrys sp.]
RRTARRLAPFDGVAFREFNKSSVGRRNTNDVMLMKASAQGASARSTLCPSRVDAKPTGTFVSTLPDAHLSSSPCDVLTSIEPCPIGHVR